MNYTDERTAERMKRYREAHREKMLENYRRYYERVSEKDKATRELLQLIYKENASEETFERPYVKNDDAAHELLTAVFTLAFDDLKDAYLREEFFRWFSSYALDQGLKKISKRYADASRIAECDKTQVEEFLRECTADYYDTELLDAEAIIREAYRQARKKERGYFVRAMRRRKVPNEIIRAYQGSVL